jgi:ABC-type glycerol-3-phosphate transport system substrate-binding protein
MRRLSRRNLLRSMGIGATAVLAAACQPKIVEVTTVVEKEVERVVKETIIVEGTPKVVEKVVKETIQVQVPAPKEKVTIQLMTWGGVDRQQPLVDAFKKRYPDTAAWLTLEPVSPGNHDAEVYEALRLALAAGGEGLPDLVQLNYIGVPEFAAANQFMNIGALMEPYYKDMLPGAQALATYKGAVVAIPGLVKTKIWYYRQDMFADAGIDANAVKTYEDYMEAGRKLNAKFPESYIMNIGPQPIHYWYFMILSHWEDVRIADEDGKYYLTENPRYKELLTWMNDWYTSGIAFNTDDWSPDWQPAFQNSVIAGSLISQWMDSFLPKYAPEQKGLWGKLIWPEFNRWGSEAGGDVWAIPNGAKHPEAAFEFARLFRLDTDGQVEEWKQSARLPNTNAAKDKVFELIETYGRPADMKDEDWAVQPINFFGKTYLDAHFEAMNYLRVFPYDPKASAELDLLRKHTEAFLAGQETIDQALAGAQADMEAQLGNPYR